MRSGVWQYGVGQYGVYVWSMTVWGGGGGGCGVWQYVVYIMAIGDIVLKQNVYIK